VCDDPAAAANKLALPGADAMSEPLLEFIIVLAFGALCFGCGYLIAFIVTRTKFRNQIPAMPKVACARAINVTEQRDRTPLPPTLTNVIGIGLTVLPSCPNTPK
jgi:hypothetical protein